MTLPNTRLPEACPVFANLSAEQTQQLLPLMEQKNYPEGESILEEGLSFQILSILMRGRCEVLKTCGGSQEQQLAVLESGAVFGEMSFFQSAPHSASVRTMSEVEVLHLTRDKYNQLLEVAPNIAFRIAESIAKILADRLRRMDEWTCGVIESPQMSVSRKEEWNEFRSKLYTEWEF